MSAVGIFRPGTAQTGFFRLRQVKLAFLRLGGRKIDFFRDTAVCWLFFALDAFLAFFACNFQVSFSSYTDKKTLVKIPVLLCKNSYFWVGTGPYVGFLAEIAIRKKLQYRNCNTEKIASLTWEFYNWFKERKKLFHPLLRSGEGV